MTIRIIMQESNKTLSERDLCCTLSPKIYHSLCGNINHRYEWEAIPPDTRTRFISMDKIGSAAGCSMDRCQGRQRAAMSRVRSARRSAAEKHDWRRGLPLPQRLHHRPHQAKASYVLDPWWCIHGRDSKPQYEKAWLPDDKGHRPRQQQLPIRRVRLVAYLS